MNCHPRPLSVLLSPLLCFAIMASGSANADELFVAHPNAQILKGAPGGFPSQWTATEGTPRAMLLEGLDLLVATEEGLIQRLDPQTGALVSSHASGLTILDMDLHNGQLLIAAGDGRVHLLDAHTYEMQGELHPQHPIHSIKVFGDQVFAGSSDGHVEFAEITQDHWSTFASNIPGTVTDIAIAGETIYYTSNQSAAVFIENLFDGLPAQHYRVEEPPTSLTISGSNILVGTSLAGIYQYDLMTWATTSVVWVASPILSMTVNLTSAVGNSSCEGVVCPCQNNADHGGCANSTGVGARLEGTGNNSLSQGDLNLRAHSLPPNKPGLLFMSQGSGASFFGDGLLCATGQGQATFRFPVRSSGANGLIEEFGVAIHSADHFGYGGMITPGSTWNFQAWYRDNPGPCGMGFNTSNAWSVSFTE